MSRWLSISASAVLAVLFCGCGTADPEDCPKRGEVDIHVQYPLSSRAAGGRFEPGDKIGLYMNGYSEGSPLDLEIAGAYASNACLSFDGQSWSGDPALYWGEGLFDFHAYYPWRGDISSISSQPFSVEEDQRIEGAMQASDVLWACTKGMSAGDRVDLAFSHRMSKVSVKLVRDEDYEGDLPENAEVRILDVAIDALMDLRTGEVIKDPHGRTGTVVARRTDAGLFEAIVVPQRLQNVRPFVEIIVGDYSFVAEGWMSFTSGCSHCIEVSLSDNPDKIKLEFDGSAGGW